MYYSMLAPNARGFGWGSQPEGVAQCLPAIATFYHARRICEALGSKLATVQQLPGCCEMGCSLTEKNRLKNQTQIEGLNIESF